MNRAQKIGFIVMALSAVAPFVIDEIIHCIAMSKPDISPELRKEIAADRYAKAIVEAKIKNGRRYTESDMDPADDFEFYRIRYFLEN